MNGSLHPPSEASDSAVKRWLALHAGLEPQLLEKPWLERLVDQRLQQLGLPDESSYCRLLERDADERERVIREISVGETALFRYPASYELLVRHLRALRSTRPERATLAMLSVACASGEEPYSMVIAAVRAGWPAEKVEVDAIDRSARALDLARTATYAERLSSPERLPAWAELGLRRDGGRWTVAEPIRRAVRFHCGDVLAKVPEWRPQACVAVFCRNLLIYLNAEARDRLIGRLAEWLEPGGLLFVGHVEQLESLRARFAPVAEPNSFAWRLRDAAGRAGARSALETAAPPERNALLPPAHAALAPGARQAHPGRQVATAANSPASPAEARADACGAIGLDRGVAAVLLPAAAIAPPPASAPRASLLPPGVPPASRSPNLLDRARQLADAGSLDEALMPLQAAIAESPLAADAYHLLGSLQLARGRLTEAQQALRRAVYLQPDHEESLLQLALVCQRMGDEPLAARYRRRAARAHQREAEERRG